VRDLRPLEPNGIYHVTIRGVRQTPLFRDETDWCRYLDFLGDAVARFRWRCHAYCLMPNHVHLLLRTPEPNLPDGMQRLNMRYAIRFNVRYGFKGHVFERRYWSKLLDDDTHLLELARYIARNPVRAGLVAHPAEWRWSSYAALVQVAIAPTFLDTEATRGLFGSAGRLRAFVEEAPAPDAVEDMPV
jgi:REP element-mobilizing transposase RayT